MFLQFLRVLNGLFRQTS